MDLANGFTFEAAAAWDEAADAWDEFVESGADFYRTEVHGPGLLKSCGPVRDLRVLDIGCGQGWFTRQLAVRGARPIGIDISQRQVEKARLHEAETLLGIEYERLPGECVSGRWSCDDFDMVTACMSLQDMPEPRAAIQGVAGVLAPGRRFVFSIPHPFTDTPYREWERGPDGKKGPLKTDRYFESMPRTVTWNMERLGYSWETPYWRLPLSEWTEMVEGAGFVLKRLDEPRPTAEQVQRMPPLEDCYRLPYFLVFDCVRS
jgi:2-polyprenyl-3-methyl-5-hydroxy-6-metoxy-1,4-benzoquinol methylase